MDIPARYQWLSGPMDGGMSSVFRYHDQVLERDVAIKTIPAGANARRIQDEINALFKLRSKHVVQVYDIFTDATEIAILQEYIDGNDLFSADTAPADAPGFLKIIWQIASGIAEIHEAGVIHRDIKPNNMKIDHEGILKIFDFGLARDEGPSASTLGFVGTHGFAAPELYLSNVTFTKTIDVYAFGATALHVALRSLPNELLEAPPKPVASNPFESLPFTIPDLVADILYRCLSPVAEHRPDMKTVADVVQTHLLYDSHRALVVNGTKASYLDKNNRSVNLKYTASGSTAIVGIKYDGFQFNVSHVSGDVFVNNAVATVGYVLPGACVLTMGGPELKNRRAYLTFDLSNPEIVL